MRSPFAETTVIVGDHRVQYCAVLLHMLPQIFGGNIVKQIAHVDGFVGGELDLGGLRCLLLQLVLVRMARGYMLWLLCYLCLFILCFYILTFLFLSTR